ncbi:MAG TPA: alpha-glucuronidase family glycosyl hydrolase, partial [Lachnospiraceae bacterium]|nr:alpha-glucuronidase family glycosyl hydrolase [Lachnospiraceae bacterium]
MWTQLWLNYQQISGNDANGGVSDCFQKVCFCGLDIHSPIGQNILKELQTSSQKMFHTEPKVTENETEAGIVLQVNENQELGQEGYEIKQSNGSYYICGQTEKAVLYGMFRFLALVRQAQLYVLPITEVPRNPIRMLNHWDNMDGSIERGYSGNSFFFHNDEMMIDDRTRDYARFLASIGINAVAINNVNVKGAATALISERFYKQVQELSELFLSFGVKLFLSVNYAMPCEYGLNTADPLDATVKEWWSNKCKEVYQNVPDLGGFLIKADSEGRPGPFTYGRTQADGANMLAEAIRPYEGLIIWRCFVYNCQQDWRDYKTDRARAGYDYFSELDGNFAENVVLQIKNGPMDFQVREPISPLFGGLMKTNQMLEVQIAQEYTGQQRHICYLIPWFKEVLAFETYLKDRAKEQGVATNGKSTVADIVSGRTLSKVNCGMVAVTNTGNDENWTGHDMAAANLYGFGRLAFNTELSAEEIAEEWIKLTFAQAVKEQKVVDGIRQILMMSWPAYEKYTSPLGIGWMVTPDCHYGPSVDGYEYSRWGTYHRADHLGIGVDRSKKGTGYAAQYNEPNASMYEVPETCPEELLLFFHHMPYT